MQGRTVLLIPANAPFRFSTMNLAEGTKSVFNRLDNVQAKSQEPATIRSQAEISLDN